MILMRARYSEDQRGAVDAEHDKDDSGGDDDDAEWDFVAGAHLPLNIGHPQCNLDWLKKSFWQLEKLPLEEHKDSNNTVAFPHFKKAVEDAEFDLAGKMLGHSYTSGEVTKVEYEGRKPKFIVVFGPPASGKDRASKEAFERLN